MEDPNQVSECEFKEVPDCVEDITPQWCEKALRKSCIIGPLTTVASVNVKRLKNEETGELDGGGMTPAQMIRITLSYDGEIDGYNPPSTIIAKCLLTGKALFNCPFHFRMLIYFGVGKHTEENFWRNDIQFYRKAVPLIKETYSYPKVYYTGIIEGGNRGFFNEVIRPMPHKIRTITLMQDMNGWKSQMVGINHLTFDEAVAILQNVAILHGSFWGEKNKEIKECFSIPLNEHETRGAAHSKLISMKRNKFLSSSQKIRKSREKMFESWSCHKWHSVTKDIPLPSWFEQNSAAGKDDGDEIFILNHPDVLEMLEVYAERFPKFSTEFVKPFFKLPSQTLLHGDFHNGNHMYLEDANGVQVVAFDFQMVGPGLAISDILRILMFSKRHITLNEDLELLKRYHEALMLSGNVDISYEELKQQFILGCLEFLTKKLMDFTESNAEKMTKLYSSMFGEEKSKDLLRIMDSGILCNPYLLVTSMYMHNKENFLNGDQFFAGI
jgi:hypothetical protein